jgi:hypothetical protein
MLIEFLAIYQIESLNSPCKSSDKFFLEKLVKTRNILEFNRMIVNRSRCSKVKLSHERGPIFEKKFFFKLVDFWYFRGFRVREIDWRKSRVPKHFL